MSYSEFVRSRFKSGEKIAEEMTAHKLALLKHCIESMVAESSRLDVVKKHAIYNKHADLFVGTIELAIVKDVEITPEQCELLHAAIGIAGEAGELLDAVRKHVFDWQPLDRENVIEELGDLNFYFEAACQAIGVSREDIEELNMAKLFERYKDGYSDQQAQERKDKQ